VGDAEAMHDDTGTAAGVQPGEVLGGKYRIERVLGIGGMGVVVAAHHLQLDEKVAIKFLLPTMLSNRDVVGRFAREARAAVKIKSEHVARVFDVGALENGAPYMVMELLEGEDLATLLGRQGPLPVEQAVDFVLQACVAIANAHALGIVHRDLKPANLFCVRGFDGQPVIKVLDFGISKMGHLSAPEVGGSMTNTTAVMGSPFYMSPEQMKSARDVDAGTDIWALGVVLYELLTGSTPFAGESFAEVAIKAATAPFTPLANLRATVPSGLETVVFTCLEKDRNNRYANVSELALALASYGSPRARPFVDRIVGIALASGLPARPPQQASLDAGAPDVAARGLLGTMAPSASTAPGVAWRQGGSRRTRTIAIAGVGSVCVAIAVGTVIAIKRSSVASALAPTASPSHAATAAVNADRGAPGATPAPAPVSPTAASPMPLSTAAQPSAEASTTAVASVDAVRGPTSAPPASHVGAARAVQRPPATHDSESKPGNPPGTGNCRVVSFFDADGNQHFKQQCGK